MFHRHFGRQAALAHEGLIITLMLHCRMTGREECTENASLTPIGSPAPMSSLCAARTTCVTQAARSWLPTIQCCSGSIDAAEGAGTCWALTGNDCLSRLSTRRRRIYNAGPAAKTRAQDGGGCGPKRLQAT